MAEFQIRLTSKILSTIADIERISGRFDQPAVGSFLAESGHRERAQREFAFQLESLSEAQPNPTRYNPLILDKIKALFAEHSLNEQLCFQINSLLNEGREAGTFRRVHQSFRAALTSELRGEEIFRNVEPYLLETRFRELMSWVQGDKTTEVTHPLLCAATFHLVFLQLSPFARLNHETGLGIIVGFLDQDYPWIGSSRFTSVLLEKPLYYATLRQAEKSVFTTWNTTPAWTEFFLASLLEAASLLRRDLNREFGFQKLTAVQEQIVEVIRSKGGATREEIADASGINASTVKYNLGVLSGRGVLERLGAGRTTSYRVN